ncbi:helicase HerA domain-containing protein [Poseidonibacter ostreae]|uniref:DUF87 domain-containing protein n=1 Tax=Poseidonibacter ostreae TaxID=2654171 RepID=A0A6L4WZ75_9BACT|nr:DUF87 domain-containing protein [Poseidonibacter ostreae]KAB7891304.1 DUF87 domain-containing protein [Poseidonibacter ostreae]
MLSKIFGIIAFIFQPLWHYYKVLNLNRVLGLSKINSEGVYLYGSKDDNNKLYVIKLVHDHDRFRPIDFSDIKRTLKYENDSQMVYFFVKQETYEMGYVATFSEKLAVELKEKFRFKICNTTETVNFLLDIYSINKFTRDKDDLVINPSINIDSIDKNELFDSFFYNFSKILSDGAYIQNFNYKMYQVAKIDNKISIPYKEVIGKEFNGVICSFVDLSNKNLSYQIKDNLAYSRRADRVLTPDFEELEKADKAGTLDALITNTVIISDKEIEARNMATKMGFEIVEKDGFDKLYIQKKTFLTTRVIDYDLIAPSSTLSKLFGVRTKSIITKKHLNKLVEGKSWVDIVVDFCGYNIYGSFVNFCFRANKNPHVCLIADSGSGKSVTVQKILSSIYRVDFEKENVKRWNDVQTRYFEIGASSASLQKFFKKLYGDEVGLIEGSMESMKFSLSDLKTFVNSFGEIEIDANSLTNSILLMNVVLHEWEEGTLTASEQSIYESAVKEVYKNGSYKGLTIGELKQISKVAYAEKIEMFKEKGYKDTTWIREITDCGDLDNLNKPILGDIVNFISREAGSTNINQQELADYQSLIKKITAVAKVENSLFGSLNSIVFNNKPFYSIEFNKIKANKKILRSLFTFMFVQIYEADVQEALRRKANGLIMKQTVYIFEEARNFIEDNPEITKLLKTLIFEGRKYQLQAFFIVQQVSHLPPEIIKGCSSFFFLLPEKEEVKLQLKKEILALYPTESVDFLLQNLEMYTLGIISDLGSFSCRLDISKKELEVFAV